MRPCSTSISALFCPKPRVPLSELLGPALTAIRLTFYAQLQALNKLFVSMFWGQWNSGHSQGFSRGRPPKSVRRHIAAHHGTGPDHRPFTNSHVRQDDTVRPDKDVLLNYNFSVACWSSGPRVKMGDYGCSEADCAVVPDCNVSGMYFIDIDKLANPDVFPDRNSAQPLQPRSQTESPR